MARVQIFLSTVSAEFRSYRDALRHDLDRPNVTVKVQEDFIATGTETLDKLDEYIQQCDAVIHLVGDMTGARANSTAVAAIWKRYPDLAECLPVLEPFLKPGARGLSYTHWEGWLALYHGKVLIIAAPLDGAPRDACYQLNKDQRAAQQEHLERLQIVGRYPEIHFANADRLAVEILRALGGVIDPPKPDPVGNYYYIINLPPERGGKTEHEEILPCPYRGLSHFDHHNSDFFFGRDTFVQELVQATQSYGFITILGASGSGKTSVVLAGLVPKLQKLEHDKGIRWQYTYFRPGSDPFYALASALIPLLYDTEGNATERMAEARKLADCLQNHEEKQADCLSLSNVFADVQKKHPQNHVLLIADQFEELYTLCPDETFQHKFLDCLLGGFKSSDSQSPPIVLVATMRASALGNALSYAPFAKVFSPENRYSALHDLRTRGTQIMLGAMDRFQLKEVIEKPAEKLNVLFEPGLVDRILDDVEKKTGNLPLLEFALMLLWEKQREKQLTHAVYGEIGEIKGALVKHADEKYAALTSDEKKQARRIFLALILLGEETEDTPRVATKEELKAENWPLIQKLADADARLLVTNRRDTGQEIVEVVHEALIQQWPQLRRWLEESRENLLQKKGIEVAAREWDSNHRNPSYLFQGRRLKRAIDFDKEQGQEFSLSRVAREFIQAGISQRRKNTSRTWGNFLLFIGLGIGIGWVIWKEAEDRLLDSRLSLGEDIFYNSHVNKRSGSDYFARGKFAQAAEQFKASLRAIPDDPETLIYLSNAMVANKNPLTIAVSVPIGRSPSIAQEMLRGIAQAQSEVNENGGINGRPLQVKIGNDDNNPEIAKNIADRLVRNSKILAVVAHNSSDVSKKGAEAYQDNLVMISPTSFALDFQTLKKPRAENYIFLSVPSYKILLPGLIDHIINTLINSDLLICVDSKAYDQVAFSNGFSKNNKLKVIPHERIKCDFSDPALNLEQVIGQGIKVGANSLFLAPHVNRINEAIDLAKINRGQLKLFGAATLYTMDTLRLGQQDIEGLVLSVYWHPDAFPKHPFYREAKKLWGKGVGVTWRTAMTYDTTQVIIEGLKEIPSSQSPTRNGLQKILSNPEFNIEGATGRVQFLPSGERKGGQAFLVEVCLGNESGAGYDFVPLGTCKKNR